MVLTHTSKSRWHLVLTCLFLFLALILFSNAASALSKKEIQGKKLALQFCQACHHYEGTEQAGTVAPPLLKMKSRFPDRKKLYTIIYDPIKVLKPHTMMPPFGRNKLMDKTEINLLIDFLYTL